MSRNTNRRVKTLFQRYEVVSGGETLRSFRKTTKIDVITAFAKDASLTSERAVAVDAVYSHGSNGQHTTCVVAFVAGVVV